MENYLYRLIIGLRCTKSWIRILTIWSKKATIRQLLKKEGTPCTILQSHGMYTDSRKITYFERW